MHIYFLSYNYRKHTPSTRYRGTYPLKSLKEKYKIKTTIFHRKQDIFYLFFLYLKIKLTKKTNVVIFQRIVKKDKISKLMEKIRKIADISILDIDDAIEDLTENKKNKKYIYDWISKTDQVWVGSKELEKNYSKYNKNIKLMTTPVPKVKLIEKEENKTFTIGWVGNYKPHKNNLDMFFNEIQNISVKIKLKLVGITMSAAQDEIKNIFNKTKVEILFPIIKNWNNEQEISNEIQTFDIGIMPQLDTKYDRAKSAFKLKQYLASNVPVLASPVGENLNVVIEVKNGMLVKDGNWKTTISNFISLNKKELSELKKNVEEEYLSSDYNMNNYIKKMYEKFNS